MLSGGGGRGSVIDRVSNAFSIENLRRIGTFTIIGYFAPLVILVALVRLVFSKDSWWRIGFFITALPTILLLLKQVPDLIQGQTNWWQVIAAIVGGLVLLFVFWPLVIIILAAPVVFTIVRYAFTLQLNWMTMLNGWISLALPSNIVSDLKSFYGNFGNLFSKSATLPKF